MVTLATAKKLYDQHKWSAAIKSYKECIAKGLVVSTEQKSEVYCRVGYACDVQKLAEAVKWYSKAIQLNRCDAYYAASSYNRGLIYEKRGEYASAVVDFSRALTVYTEPNSVADCYFNRADVYRAVDIPSLEMSDLQKAISLHTDSTLIAKYSKRLKQLQSKESAKRKRDEQESFGSQQLKSSSNGGGGGGGGAVDSMHGPKSAPLLMLSVSDVSDYLRSIGQPFESYAESFAANFINGAALCKLTDFDLSELLGVRNRLHRNRILRYIESVAAAGSSGSGAAGSGGGGAADSSQALIEQLLAEQKSASDNKLCVVCLTAPKSICFSPCGHICCCTECGDKSKLKKCPLCRGIITGRQKAVVA